MKNGESVKTKGKKQEANIHSEIKGYQLHLIPCFLHFALALAGKNRTLPPTVYRLMGTSINKSSAFSSARMESLVVSQIPSPSRRPSGWPLMVTAPSKTKAYTPFFYGRFNAYSVSNPFSKLPRWNQASGWIHTPASSGLGDNTWSRLLCALARS